MIKYTISVILLTLAACMVQQFLPAISGLHGARVLILPLVFLCAAASVDFPPMLLLAFICGFLWDAQHALAPHGGNPEVYTTPVESLSFGYSIILYALMGLLMQGIQPLFRNGKWHISSLLAGIAIFLYLFSEYLLINFVRGDFVFPPTAFYRIYLTSALTMLFSPIIFWLIFQLSSACQHTIRYDGLKNRSRLSV
ncbi:MAG: hypothetical protein KJO21_12180 [Verrucomicrobiae bacterium]|nr:hypothetical protein [Verrucomicrobiae bacterium]NNJ43977.1 hypothetical protein [Akkermansiaceae bacterium]